MRSRIAYSLLIVCTVGLGLLSRRFAGEIPFIRAYVGDALWALMVFSGIALILNRQPAKVIAVLAGLFAFGIEISQLYHAPWIDGLRATYVGGLILGFSFVWSDLLCYSVGIVIGVMIDRPLNKVRQ